MGVIVLDAGVVIALLDANDRHHVEARRSFERARASGDQFVLPASAYAEVLVGPLRRDPSLADVVDAFLEALPATVAPASREVARAAAMLRAQQRRLRLPDALVIATGIVLGVDRVITTDAGWPQLQIAVEVLKVTGFKARPLPPGVDRRARLPDSLRSPTPDEDRRGVVVAYRMKNFTVYRAVIERLRPGERFRMETDFGTVEMSAERFAATFPNIVASASYRLGPPSQPGSCWYTITGRMPPEARPFLLPESPRKPT